MECFHSTCNLICKVHSIIVYVHCWIKFHQKAKWTRFDSRTKRRLYLFVSWWHHLDWNQQVLRGYMLAIYWCPLRTFQWGCDVLELNWEKELSWECKKWTQITTLIYLSQIELVPLMPSYTLCNDLIPLVHLLMIRIQSLCRPLSSFLDTLNWASWLLCTPFPTFHFQCDSFSWSQHICTKPVRSQHKKMKWDKRLASSSLLACMDLRYHSCDFSMSRSTPCPVK